MWRKMSVLGGMIIALFYPQVAVSDIVSDGIQDLRVFDTGGHLEVTGTIVLPVGATFRVAEMHVTPRNRDAGAIVPVIMTYVCLPVDGLTEPNTTINARRPSVYLSQTSIRRPLEEPDARPYQTETLNSDGSIRLRSVRAILHLRVCGPQAVPYVIDTAFQAMELLIQWNLNGVNWQYRSACRFGGPMPVEFTEMPTNDGEIIELPAGGQMECVDELVPLG